MKNIATLGSVQSNLLPQINENFNDLFARPGTKINRFLSKCQADTSILKDNVIRVCTVGDSVDGAWMISDYWIMDILATLYPKSTFEYKAAQKGGTGSDYILSASMELINWNPDLLIFLEWEGTGFQYEYSKIILREFRKRTSCDIAIIPFSIYSADMQLLSAKNYNGWLTSPSSILRNSFAQLATEFNAELIDWHVGIIQNLWNGSAVYTDYLLDTVHPTNAFFAEANKVILKHFHNYDAVESNLIYTNGHLLNNHTTPFNYQFFNEVIDTPDITNIVKSGTWAVVKSLVDKTNNRVQSSQAGAYIQTSFEGIGLELFHYGSHIGAFDILIDGVAPNTLLKDYVTAFSGYDNTPYKVLVNTNILSDAEASRGFSITMTSATTYSIKDVTNNNVLGTGNISTDGVFSCTGGQITIPANYAGTPNFRSTITNGTVFTFSIKKNWYNQITQSVNNLTNVTRIFGLNRGTHTLRLTVVSGTVNLDSIMELK